MAIRARLIRPDDLLNLEVEGINLRLDLENPDGPALVVEDEGQQAFLVVHFPPQAITEEAFYQSSATPPPPSDAGKPINQKPATANLQAPTGLARARIGGASGSTRLVFRVPADRPIPYTVESLLDWRDLELSVSPLADIPEQPTPEQIYNAPAITPPSPQHTALELPYRLVISPAHDVIWDHALGLKTHAGRTEMWHTRLARPGVEGIPQHLSRLNPAALRAIWSPDYNPDRFQPLPPPQVGPPFMGPPYMGQPDQDWDNASGGVLTAMTPSDRHEIVILTSAFRGFVKGFRDDLSIDESPFVPSPVRAEQVILSPLGGWLKSRGGWNPPMHWQQRRPFIQAVEPIVQFEGLIGLLRPHILDPDLRTATPPPGAASDASRQVRGPIGDLAIQMQVIQALNAFDINLLGTLGPSLNISEWVHEATQGRDHYVRIVYEGVLYPCRHRAALVKITERKIADVNGSPVAFLAQRMFIVVRQPEVDYDEDRGVDAKYGRRMPLRRLRLTRLVTPDIDKPQPFAGEYTFKISVGGQPFRFPTLAADIGHHPVDSSAATIFVPLSDLTAKPSILPLVRQTYLDWSARPCPVPGQQVTYAERAAGAASDNTTLTTRVLHFTTDDAPGGAGFRPHLFTAEVKLPAVEQLLGTDAPAQIAYEQKYLDSGFDAGNSTGVFAQLVKESATHQLTADKLQARFAADQAGGISTPDLSISALTRELGPLAGDNLAALRANQFDPAEFFKDVKDAAKLFGSIPLVDLIVGGTMEVGAPKVQLAAEPVVGNPNQRRLIAALDWQPEVRNAKAGIVVLTRQPATRLSIHGRVERLVEVPPAGSPGPATSRFEGELTDFTIELLNVVALHFRSFHFVSETGKKPDVTVALSEPDPLAFKGDLEFVNDLKDFIPPGLFGEGASLDVTPARVKAGFGIGLPPIAIGVFSLKGIALNAFIELPFLNGKPLFDFGISSREHPFCLTVAFLGGGGFFHLQVDTDGVRLLEAALEFGAAVSIDLGVASGGVHIMAGVYFAMGKKDGKEFSILAGYLRMGGELSVLGIISMSLEFVLSFAYEDGKAAGRATLTVKVEIVFFSVSVEISVEKRFGGSSGDPRFFQVFETPDVWTDYASAFA